MKIYDRIKQIFSYRQQIVFFELGACDGQHTKEITDILEPACYLYYAFEPDSRRIEGLKFYVGGRVSIIPKAIGAIDGRAKFYISCLDYYGSSSLRKPTPELLKDFPKMTFEEGEVDVVRLDTFCWEKQIEHIDFIWSDIQGAEADLIEGGREMLKRTDFLYTEYNNGPAYEGCLDLQGILERLPGWTLIEDYDGDAILKNECR
jgi:FkbM family methyltransferase